MPRAVAQADLWVLTLARRWQLSKNPQYIDDAVSYCDVHDLPVTSELRRLLADVAKLRRNGKATAAMREGTKAEAFRVMANLIIHGCSIGIAASKAARYINGAQGFVIRKASSLEKQYEKAWRSGSPSQEDLLRQDYAEHPDAEQSAKWRQLANEMPHAISAHSGERR